MKTINWLSRSMRFTIILQDWRERRHWRSLSFVQNLRTLTCTRLSRLRTPTTIKSISFSLRSMMSNQLSITRINSCRRKQSSTRISHDQLVILRTPVISLTTKTKFQDLEQMLQRPRISMMSLSKPDTMHQRSLPPNSCPTTQESLQSIESHSSSE